MISLLSSEFKNICNELIQIGDTIDINLNDNNITFSSENESISENIKLNFDEDKILKINYEENLKFNITNNNYISNILKNIVLTN